MKKEIQTFLKLKRKDFLFYALICLLLPEIILNKFIIFSLGVLFAFLIYLFFRENDIHPLRKREDEVDWEALWKDSEKLSEIYRKANEEEKKQIKAGFKKAFEQAKTKSAFEKL